MVRKPAKTERDTASRADAERLGFRLDAETKDLIERAAELSRRKVSDFCVTAVTETARRTIAEHETLELSDRDREAFVDALINPPEPSERLARALATHHDRDAFSCGVDSLDRYVRSQAGQDVRRRANGVFILVAADAVETVLGYYTLCATSLQQGDVPAAARKHVPRYPLVSATLLARLAIARTRQGFGLGALLFADAVRRACSSAQTVGSSMLVVDALNERAAAFYQSFGFQLLPDSLRLVLPMHSIEKLLAR